MLITKSDLLPYVPFDLERAKKNAHRVNANAEIVVLSCQTGEGLGAWMEWLRDRQRVCSQARPCPTSA